MQMLRLPNGKRTSGAEEGLEVAIERDGWHLDGAEGWVVESDSGVAGVPETVTEGSEGRCNGRGSEVLAQHRGERGGCSGVEMWGLIQRGVRRVQERRLWWWGEGKRGGMNGLCSEFRRLSMTLNSSPGGQNLALGLQ